MTAEDKQSNDNSVEDLTLKETETAEVKGGAAVDYFLRIDGIKGETSGPSSK